MQESPGEAAWPVISRITKGKFFPSPFGKLPLFRRRKVYASVSAGSSSLFWGRPKTTTGGQQEAQPSQMPPVGLISPASSTQITPGSQTTLHISGGENPTAVLQCDKSYTAVTHPHILCCPFPSCFKLIYFCKHWPILKKRGSSEPLQSSFSQERKTKLPWMCRCSKTH